jgi:hypothetical protein
MTHSVALLPVLLQLLARWDGLLPIPQALWR